MVAVVAGAFVTPVLAPAAAQASPCEYGGGNTHWYATAQSGAGSNQGTGAYMQTWTNWSLDGHPASDGPFSDEAVWTYDQNSGNDALEVGFLTGYAINLGTIDNSMFPYVTINNDQNPQADEDDFTGTTLPTDTMIWNSATSNGTSTWAYVNNTQIAYFANYGVSTPRVNYEQTEVDYPDIWMGGGSGSFIQLYYQTSSNAWKPWGSENVGTSWYNLTTKQGGSPANWGYWATSQPPYEATEGGYGQSC
jgi:hypothetical protein